MNAPFQLEQRLEEAINTLQTQIQQNPKFSVSDRLLIQKAIERGKFWHSGQYRDTGDFYFIHPVRVAIHTLSFASDPIMVISALLHDTLEDTKASYENLMALFNAEIAEIVKALTRFKKEERNISAHRIFTLAKKDFRVLLIKMFDRLDNLSDLHKLARTRQRNNADESLIFGAVAEGLGLEDLADDFRNSAFKILYPRRFNQLKEEVSKLKETNRVLHESIQKSLCKEVGPELCRNVSIEFKTPFDFVMHSAAILNVLKSYTLTVDAKLDCYQAIGKLHLGFPVIPLRFHDYLANPLANGWQGLETSLIVHGLTVQVIITTAELDHQNRQGLFTLLNKKTYQANRYNACIEKFLSLFSEKNVSLEEVFRGNKNSFILPQGSFGNSFFQVSTPKGKILQMESGSTVLDFAYAIHTQIGETCAGAIINESFRVEPSYRLQEGNVVEVLTDKNLTPDKSWLKIAQTPHARKDILSYLRKNQKTA